MKAQVKTFTTKDATWINAAGDEVPVKHVTPTEKAREATANKLHKAALKAEAALTDLYVQFQEAKAEAMETMRREFELKTGRQKAKSKGNFTWYCFNNSIKMEANINDILKWDNAIMTEAYKLMDEYISSQLTDNQSLIKSLVSDAFSTSKGEFDPRKVFQLLKYECKINSSKFKKACELMRQAQRIDSTKLYMRISEKMEDGSYRPINLNFSSL